MKYTFISETGEKTVNIPDEFINRTTTAYGVSKREAIQMYLSDEGYISNDTVQELTEKARGQKHTVRNAAPRKRTRKPDDIKRAIIASLHEFLTSQNDLQDLEVINPERVISFKYKNDTYELTLSRKRKPKA